MALRVDAPLGSSPLTVAVVRVLEGIDGVTAVLIGPPLFADRVPDWSCCLEHGQLKLMMPIEHGFRVFLISCRQRVRGADTSVEKISTEILRKLHRTNLPAEVAADDTSSRWPHHPPTRSKVPLPPQSPEVDRPIVGQPPTSMPPILLAPAMTPVPMIAWSLDGIVADVRAMADEDGRITGLLPLLRSQLGGTKDEIRGVINGLLAAGLIRCVLGPESVTAPYEKYEVIKPAEQ